MEDIFKHELTENGKTGNDYQLICDGKPIVNAGGGVICYEGVKTFAVRLTREFIEALLERNENRTLRTSKVKLLMGDFRHESVLYTPDDIILGRDELDRLILLNGQHRLTALSMLSKEEFDQLPDIVQQLSVWNDISVYSILDSNTPRTTADRLRLPQRMDCVLRLPYHLIRSKAYVDTIYVVEAMYKMLQAKAPLILKNENVFRYQISGARGVQGAIKCAILLYCLKHNDFSLWERQTTVFTNASISTTGDRKEEILLGFFRSVQSSKLDRLNEGAILQALFFSLENDKIYPAESMFSNKDIEKAIRLRGIKTSAKQKEFKRITQENINATQSVLIPFVIDLLQIGSLDVNKLHEANSKQ